MPVTLDLGKILDPPRQMQMTDLELAFLVAVAYVALLVLWDRWR